MKKNKFVNSLPILAFFLALLFLAGCTQQQVNNQPIVPVQENTQVVIVKTATTGLGEIIVNNNGMSLYDFRADTNGQSTCYGQCAQYWPPLLIENGKTPIGEGVTATLGTTTRTDGTVQVTANGLPLYYFAGDKVAGDVNGQGSTGAGALWYVLDKTGKEITTPLSANAEKVVKTKETSLGTILVGPNGMTLYDFRADTSGKSTCYGQCAYYWPPLLVKEGTPTGEGVTATLGTTTRTDGTIQVTANGMPLYYYTPDSKPGDVKGQGSTGSGALWYVLGTDGKEITTMPDLEKFSFFVTSKGSGNGANLGGLSGADNICQNLAESVGAKDKTWKAYLSTTGDNSVNARDRIGSGPWYNIKGVIIADSVETLHGTNFLTKETALSEKGQVINGRGDTPNRHDILTGSDMLGRAITSANDTTCSNWMSSADGVGSAMLGHSDRLGLRDDDASKSWITSHYSRGCSQENLKSTGGDGLFYCFATG